MTASPTKPRVSSPKTGTHLGRHRARPQSPFLSIGEIASWFGVEVGFVRRLIAERRIPFVKIGKYIRFDPDEIAEWIDGQRVHPELGASRRRNFGDS